MSLKYHIDVSIQMWLWTSSWHHFDVANIPTLTDVVHYEQQNVIILMSHITEVINVSKISYWCLFSTVIMNIILTLFWCNIPILEYMSKVYYEHQNAIILMSLITDVINVSKIYWCLYSTVIMNIVVLTSFWCNIPILE